MELPHRVFGQPLGSSEILVFLSGFPDDEHSFDELASQFEATHTIVTLGMLGCNGGPIPRWGYEFGEVVTAMEWTLDKLKVDKFVLVGHGWGSFISFLFIEHHPQRVTNFITLDVGMGTPMDHPWWVVAVYLAYRATLAWAFVLRAVGLNSLGILAIALFPWRLMGPTPYETRMPSRVQAWSKRPDLGMCYPFFHLFKGVLSGKLKPPRLPFDTLRILFLYGKNKRISFHAPWFLAKLEAHAGSAWKALDCGHFMQNQVPNELHAEIVAFLKPTAKP